MILKRSPRQQQPQSSGILKSFLPSKFPLGERARSYKSVFEGGLGHFQRTFISQIVSGGATHLQIEDKYLAKKI